MGSARVRRTVCGVGPPARGDMGTSQKSGFVWTFFMGFASAIAPSPAPLPVPNGKQMSNTLFCYPLLFPGTVLLPCVSKLDGKTATQSCGATFGSLRPLGLSNPRR
jgi:hypothetical protein